MILLKLAFGIDNLFNYFHTALVVASQISLFIV